MNILESIFGRRSPSPPSDWKEYKSIEWGYRVVIPPSSEITVHEEYEDNSTYGRIKLHSIKSDEGNDDYWVWRHDLGREIDSQLTDQIINAGVSKGARVVSRAPVMGHPSVVAFKTNQRGFLYTYQKTIVLKDAFFTLKVFRGRGYDSRDLDVMLSEPPRTAPPVSAKPDDNIRAFFDSFALL